ncbi:MAG TPA: SRPBCC family protein, partial [Bacteroidia bacterium]
MKKFLKYFFIIVLALTLIFFSLGLIFCPVTYTNEVKVKSSNEHAFTVFMDMSKMPKWMNGFKKMELVDGFPFMKGSVYRLTLVQKGKEYVMTETLTGIKVFREFDFTIENDVLVNEVQILFAEQDGQTTITVKNKVKGKNIFWRSMFVMSKGYLKNTQQEMYEA